MITVRVQDRDGNVEQHVFHQNELTIGRVAGNDLVLAKGSVSKKHARITLRDGNTYVTDLKSTNGTSVEGQKIQAAHIVRPDERVGIGDFLLSFVVAQPGMAPVPPPVSQPLPAIPPQLSAQPNSPAPHPTPRGLAATSRAPSTAALPVGGPIHDDEVDELIESLPSGQPSSPAAHSPRGGTPIAPVPVVGNPSAPIRPLPAPGTGPLPMAGRPATSGPAPSSAPRAQHGTMRRNGLGALEAPSSPAVSLASPPSDPPGALARNTFTNRGRLEDSFSNRSSTRSFRLRLESSGRIAVPGQGSGGYSLPQPTPPFVHARSEAVAALIQTPQVPDDLAYPPETGMRAQLVSSISQTLDRLDSSAPVQEGDRRLLIRLIADDLTAVGPCEAYLYDADIASVHAPTWDRVYLTRRGRTVPAPYAFASPEAFVRAIRRVVAGRTGSDGTISELRTIDGLLFRVSDPNGPAPSLFAMRETAPTVTLDDIVDRGAAPASLAALLPQLLRAGAGIAIVASSIFDAAHVARALAARAAHSLPVIAGSTDPRLAELGIGVVEPTETFGADVDALSPAVVLFDDVDFDAVSNFLTYPGTRASAWLLPISATTADLVLPQVAATLAQLQGVPESLARDLTHGRLHCIVQVQRASDGRLFVSSVWDLAGSGGDPVMSRIYRVTSSPSGFGWEESTPAPRIAALLSSWAETGVAFDPGVDAAFWCTETAARRVALTR